MVRGLHNGVLELITTETQILVVVVYYIQLERQTCVVKRVDLTMMTLKQIAVLSVTTRCFRKFHFKAMHGSAPKCRFRDEKSFPTFILPS